MFKILNERLIIVTRIDWWQSLNTTTIAGSLYQFCDNHSLIHTDLTL
jgi:hypothetical protein